MQETIEKWTESPVADARLDGKPGISLRLLAEADLPRKTFVDNFYFTGVYVMRCYAGAFRFSFDDRDPFTLHAGELVVVYPGHYVTVAARHARNRLLYCIFDGPDAPRFFDDLGFFDCARGRTAPRIGAFRELQRQAASPEGRTEAGHRAALRLLADIHVSQLRDLRANGRAFLYDAAYRIHANLAKGVVRLEPLCAELKTSRSHLHRVFADAGLPSPSEIIRREQLRLAVRLLRQETLPIPEVMEKCGFISQAHFSTFIKRHTGHTPSEIRHGA